jgi:isoleucyl-tRNA synthetase
MEAYRLFNVVPRLVLFIDDLTNWYIRRARQRFWAGAEQKYELVGGLHLTPRQDKAAAYATLNEVLVTFSRVLAPFMPFLTEIVHQRLVVPVDKAAPLSVHFCDYPQADESLINPELEKIATLTRSVVSLGRKIREDQRLKVRQPLATLTIIHRDPVVRELVLRSAQLIREELNVKDVATSADESLFTTVSVKPNFKTLGKRCGKKLGAIKAILDTWTVSEVTRLEAGQSIEIDGETIVLDDVLLHRETKGESAVATDGTLTVALDTHITPELRDEGHAREFISQVQNARKEAGFEVSDRISLVWSSENTEVQAALQTHSDAICREVLALSMSEGPCVLMVELNGVSVGLDISKH